MKYNYLFNESNMISIADVHVFLETYSLEEIP